jgi:hypothetical protein
VNILDMMPNFKSSEDDDELVQHDPRGVKSQGPRKVKYMTNGQVRRAQARAQATAARKANKRYRRSWMRNELAFAILRGQLEVMAHQPETDGTRILVERHLTKAYGSVEAATKHFEAIVEDRLRARMAQQKQSLDAMPQVGYVEADA